MQHMRRSTLFAALSSAVVVAAAPLAQAGSPPAFVPGSWTLAIVPDIQNPDPAPLLAQGQWIADNRSTYNIQYALQLGDITNGNEVAQWQAAQQAFGKLDTAGIGYSLVPGNHDFSGGYRNTGLSTYFPVSALQNQPTFGGVYEAGKSENTYSLFSAGGKNYVVLALEWGPRDSVLTWANGVLDTYSSRTAIVVTHAYLYNDDTRYDWAAKGTTQAYNPHEGSNPPGEINDGQEMWDKLIKDHQNVEWVFNGHVLGDGNGRLDSVGTNGNVVHQVLSNYQAGVSGVSSNQGYMRLMEFQPDGKVQVKTYSPYTDTWLTDAANQFRYPLAGRPPAPVPVLLGHWSMDEGTGQVVADDSGNGRNGTIGTSSNVDNYDPAWSTGGHTGLPGDRSILIDSASSVGKHVRVLNNAALTPTSGITISAWVNPSAVKDGIIVSKHGGGTSGSYTLGVNGNGSLRFMLITNDGGIVRTNLDSSVIDYTGGEWHNIIGTYDGSYMRLYWDGVLVARAAKGGDIQALANDLRFGAYDSYGSTGYSFFGLIDDVSLFGVGLDDGGAELGQAVGEGSQIYTLYTQGAPALAAVPEPATLAMLGAGALILLKRRRRAN